MTNYRKKTITAHCIVKNEENWVWYALMSVIDWVDQLLVFDTGSTDKTVEIIRTIKSPKLVFEQKGEVNEQEFTALRNEQLERTKTDWVLLVDGDEIWPRDSIKALGEAINEAPDGKEAVVVRYWHCVGDIYHYLPVGLKLKYPYAPKDKIGWMIVRAYKKNIPGLQCVGPYGREGYEDENGQPVQAGGQERLIFLDKYYLHMTFLPRSSQDDKVLQRGPKRRFELGRVFPKEFVFPEVFSFKRPKIVPSPWTKAGVGFWVKSALLTPYFRLRRFLYQKIVLPDYNPRYQRPKIVKFFYQLFRKRCSRRDVQEEMFRKRCSGRDVQEEMFKKRCSGKDVQEKMFKKIKNRNKKSQTW